MYKHLLTAVLLFSCLAAQAQSRMVAKANLTYDEFRDNYKLVDSNWYKYSGNRTGAPNEAINCDTGMLILQYPDSLDIDHRYIQRFDANERIISYVYEIPDNGGWKKMGEEVYTYDAAGHLSLISTMYPFTPGVWSPRQQTINTYNSSGNLVHVLKKHVINLSTPTVWDTFYRSSYTYNASGKLLVQVDTTFAGMPHEADSTIYTYNNSGLCVYIARRHLRDFLGASWENRSANAFTYNTRNDVHMQYYLDANGDTTVFERHDYNSNFQLTSLVSRRSDSTVYTYNGDGHITSAIDYKWFGGSWMHRTGNPATVFYYEANFPVNVAQLKQQGGTVQLYPVPANNTLNITINWKEAQPYTLTIADMQGRVNRQYNSQSTIETIDVSMLPEGVYNLILKGDKGGVQHSRFSVIR